MKTKVQSDRGHYYFVSIWSTDITALLWCDVRTLLLCYDKKQRHYCYILVQNIDICDLVQCEICSFTFHLRYIKVKQFGSIDMFFYLTLYIFKRILMAVAVWSYRVKHRRLFVWKCRSKPYMAHSVNNPRLNTEGEATWPTLLCFQFKLQMLKLFCTTYFIHFMTYISVSKEGKVAKIWFVKNRWMHLLRGRILIVTHTLSTLWWWTGRDNLCYVIVDKAETRSVVGASHRKPWILIPKPVLRR